MIWRGRLTRSGLATAGCLLVLALAAAAAAGPAGAASFTQILTQPASQTVTAGQTVTFSSSASSVDASVTSALWQVSTDGGATWTTDATDSTQTSSQLNGVDTATVTTTLTIAAATVAQTGNEYRAVFSGITEGAVDSNAATLTVGPPTGQPVITTQPQNQVVTAGQLAVFTAGAVSSPSPSVQWQVSTDGGTTWSNDTTDNGPNGDSLVILSSTAAENGNQYRAVFTNGTASATSNAATLTVLAAQPPTSYSTSTNLSCILLKGLWSIPGTVGFSVTADGPQSVTPGESFALTSLTESVTLPGNWATALANDSITQLTGTIGGLAVDVSPATPATLSLAVPASFPGTPVVSGQPIDLVGNGLTTSSATAGGSPGGLVSVNLDASALAVTIHGSGPAPGGGTTAIGDNLSCTLPATPLLLASLPIGAASGSAAAPSVTEQPSPQTLTAGSTATFTAAASGFPVPTPQWQVSSDGGATWSNDTTDSGATDNTLTIASTTVAQSGDQFRAVFTNASGSVTSAPATLTVNPPPLAAPVITSQPSDITEPSGDSAAFAAAASGNPTPTVQWQVSTDGGTTWTNDTTDAGATTNTLTVASTTDADSGNEYRAIFTNSQGSVTSNAATLFTGAPNITSEPTTQLARPGGTATFTATAVGNPTPTLQWQVSTNQGGTWTNDTTDAGATTNTLTVSSITSSENDYWYRMVATNKYGAAYTYSGVGLIVTADSPIVATQPVSQTVVAGQTATFTSTATGSPQPTVQWQVSTDGGLTWSAISGATSTTLTVASTTTAMSGYEYRAYFLNSSGADTSSAATLTVTPPPSNAPVVSRVAPNRGGPYSLVLIAGRNLGGAKTVDFGAGHPAFFLPLSSTSIVALAPSERKTTVDVTVTTANGTSATSSADQFTFR